MGKFWDHTGPQGKQSTPWVSSRLSHERLQRSDAHTRGDPGTSPGRVSLTNQQNRANTARNGSTGEWGGGEEGELEGESLFFGADVRPLDAPARKRGENNKNVALGFWEKRGHNVRCLMTRNQRHFGDSARGSGLGSARHLRACWVGEGGASAVRSLVDGTWPKTGQPSDELNDGERSIRCERTRRIGGGKSQKKARISSEYKGGKASRDSSCAGLLATSVVVGDRDAGKGRPNFKSDKTLTRSRPNPNTREPRARRQIAYSLASWVSWLVSSWGLAPMTSPTIFPFLKKRNVG